MSYWSIACEKSRKGFVIVRYKSIDNSGSCHSDLCRQSIITVEGTRHEVVVVVSFRVNELPLLFSQKKAMTNSTMVKNHRYSLVYSSSKDNVAPKT